MAKQVGDTAFSGAHFTESEIIKIIAGKGDAKRTFLIHRDLLAPSKFLQACINSGFEETTIKTISLPEDNPESVELFIKWCYSGKIDVKALPKWTTTQTINDFLFTDKIFAEAYCNDLIDAQRSYDHMKPQYWDLQTLILVYNSGLRHNNLAKYAVKSNVWEMQTFPDGYAKTSKVKDLASFAEQTVMQDVIQGIVEYRKQPYDRPHSLKGCHFHSHEEGSACSTVNAKKT